MIDKMLLGATEIWRMLLSYVEEISISEVACKWAM